MRKSETYRNLNKGPQFDSVAGVPFVLFVTGSQLAWQFDRDLKSFPWAKGHSELAIATTSASFFIAAAIGVCCTHLIINRLSKKIINIVAATFAMVGSAGFIAVPENLFFVAIARSILGLAHGCVYLTCIVHASEVMTQMLRGAVVASINVIIIVGMLVSLTFITISKHDAHKSQIVANHVNVMMVCMGVIGFILGVVALILILSRTRESPVALIRQKQCERAMETLCRLRCKPKESQKVWNEFNELKTMVDEDEKTSPGIFADGNMKPLSQVILLRLGSVLVFNSALNMIRLRGTTSFEQTDAANLSAVFFMVVRLTSALVSLRTIDTLGRRLHFLVSFFGSGFLLISMGVFDAQNLSFTMGIFQIAYELVVGSGMGMIADVYSSEAFNTIKKSSSISLSLVIEFVLQAAIAVFAFDISSNGAIGSVFMIISGALVVSIGLFLFKKFPETNQMTIRESRSEFLKPK